jgi:hypothetical protein
MTVISYPILIQIIKKKSIKLWYLRLSSFKLKLQWFSRIVVVTSTKQYRTVLFLENYVVRTPVPNTVLWKIFNMFDRIKLIKRYIFFNKIKVFLCLMFVYVDANSFPKKVRYGTVWYCSVLFGTVWYCLELVTTTIRENHCS